MTVPVVVVAGATGRIGGAVARAVLARGGRVAAAVRKPWQVDKLRAALASDRALVARLTTAKSIKGTTAANARSRTILNLIDCHHFMPKA